ncbi:MAG: DUF3572 domain-containing protein [Rhizomicrobium sp.]|jgi:hypothetical protein
MDFLAESATTRLIAETVALKCLTFIAGTPEALSRFLTASGASAEMIREHADDPGFLSAVLDFILSDDDLLTEFCGAESLSARSIHLASAALGGAACG